MAMSNFTFGFANIIYALPPPPKERTKELKVICCGLPRSGTESLHRALGVLGYSPVHHGITSWIHNANSYVLYYKLAMLRAAGRAPNAESLRRDYFDRVLGEYEATTDIPAAWFSQELLLAYPEAKIILNRRRDLKAWKESFRNAIKPLVKSWSYWTWSWFEAELFWLMTVSYFVSTDQLFGNNFENNAERVYVEHYEKLELRLEQDQRSYLKWSVEDGWSPLCEFLNHSEPETKFPEGNVAAEFGPKLMAGDALRIQKAKRNAGLLFGAGIGAIAIAVVWWRQ